MEAYFKVGLTGLSEDMEEFILEQADHYNNYKHKFYTSFWNTCADMWAKSIDLSDKQFAIIIREYNQVKEKRIQEYKDREIKRGYDIEDNLVCWRCKHASIEGGREYYGIKPPEIPKRPGCKMWSKLTEVDAWDIPDPMGPIDEDGCKFIDIGYDIREIEISRIDTKEGEQK